MKGLSDQLATARKKISTTGRHTAGNAKAPISQLKSFALIFDSIHDGAIVIDAEGYITHFNRAYGKFLGIDPEYPLGKHCTDVIENTRMHIVAKTGKPEINRTQQIKGQEMMVQRIPIRRNGEIIGVYGQVIFKNIKEVTKLATRLSMLESKVNCMKRNPLACGPPAILESGQQRCHQSPEERSP